MSNGATLLSHFFLYFSLSSNYLQDIYLFYCKLETKVDFYVKALRKVICKLVKMLTVTTQHEKDILKADTYNSFLSSCTEVIIKLLKPVLSR